MNNNVLIYDREEIERMVGKMIEQYSSLSPQWKKKLHRQRHKMNGKQYGFTNEWYSNNAVRQTEKVMTVMLHIYPICVDVESKIGSLWIELRWHCVSRLL